MIEKNKEVLDFISNYDKEKIIYPNEIKNIFGLNGYVIYSILDSLVQEGILKRVYLIQCTECGYVDKTLYESLNQIADNQLICHKCRCHLHILQDIIML